MRYEIPDHIANAALAKTGAQRLSDALVELIGAEERICASETCVRVFLLQDGRSLKHQHRTKGVLYCTKRCASAQAQREYRRRRKDKSE